MERVKTEHEQEVRELEHSLSEKREELDKMRIEKSKLLSRCEKLDAKVLHMQASDGTKP